jgi:hypothetical protein
MSDNWDFYLCRVDDEPASIFVDLGIARSAPTADYPYLAYISLHMQKPRTDGLSSQEEYESLSNIENRLSSLLDDNIAIYVGRNTSGGCRDYYFFAREVNAWKDLVSSAMMEFPDYKYDLGSHHDPDWKTYFAFLYPSDEDMERVHNRRVCESLESKGDLLNLPREIDHWIYFSDEESLTTFIATANKQGFKIRGFLTSKEPGKTHGVQLFRKDLPSFENIDDVTLPLYRAAKEAGGQYDGWESIVIN